MPKSNIKIVERGKIDTHNIQMHDCSLSWFGSVTAITRMIKNPLKKVASIIIFSCISNDCQNKGRSS
jgi:hypothetical protein